MSETLFSCSSPLVFWGHEEFVRASSVPSNTDLWTSPAGGSKLNGRYGGIMVRLISAGLIALFLQASPVETRIVEYLKANVTPGKPVVVSDLYNNVFKTPEEQKALEHLYNTFFKIPMFIVQYNAGSKRIPTLNEISEQFNFKVPGEADVILRVMESDPRVPKFIERDPKTGEITKVDIDKIKASPQFSRVLDRTIAGWE